MFYSSRFLTALSELGAPITHQHKSEEDAMFAAASRSKGQGVKPIDAALAYFVTQAERGIRNDPKRWRPITKQAALRVKGWLSQQRIEKQSAKMLFDLIRRTVLEEA